MAVHLEKGKYYWWNPPSGQYLAYCIQVWQTLTTGEFTLSTPAYAYNIIAQIEAIELQEATLEEIVAYKLEN